MKIGFLDFWHDFDVNNNFFKDTISSFLENVTTTSPDDCDILFFSCYGAENCLPKYQNKIRIFYTGENLRRPEYLNKMSFMSNCDISLSFDFDESNGKNIRLPLWLLQIDWYKKTSYVNPKFLIQYDQIYNNRFINKNNRKFCCSVFNDFSPNRRELIEKLSKYKLVDCYGKPFGNWFNGEDLKMEIISNYKFNVCLENSIYPGYYTEKPIQSKVSGCVPIYWADNFISNDFNSKSFINLYNFSNIDSMVDYIIEVDKNDEKYESLKNEKIFNEDQDPKVLFEETITKFRNKFLKIKNTKRYEHT